jgi:hypothetical protein
VPRLPALPKAAAPVEEPTVEGPTVDTTAEEMAYYIVQAILAQMVEPERVILRDQKSYCSVLLDDSNRKPICRLWFNTSQKYIGLFDAAKVETRVPIANLTEIYRQATMLRETVDRYENVKATPTEPPPVY